MALQEVSESIHHQPLGADVENLEFVTPDGGKDVISLIRCLTAVDTGCRDAILSEGIDLVLHERQKRADDDGHSGQSNGRNLEAEGFPAPCRKNDERVSARDTTGNGLSLLGKKGFVAPILLQDIEYSIQRSPPISLSA